MSIKPYRCYGCNFRTYVWQKGDDSLSFIIFSDKIAKLIWSFILIMIAVFISIVVLTRIE